MARFTGWCVAVLVGSAAAATPATAQSKDAFSSLTHAVSVTLAPRVKVKVSALSSTSSRYANLALTVNANRSWVLATADTVLASGTASSAIDTTVVFRNASKPRASSASGPLVLTITAP